MCSNDCREKAASTAGIEAAIARLARFDAIAVVRASRKGLELNHPVGDAQRPPARRTPVQ
ncbi:hypothetical protein [Phormidium sp. CCY1219]|uniref:hypothetical protein n=1 Tax=Phormidium sp. CCY1219 TaxID=2886104 RepID=UPI002D1E6A27|nr:hypothetical protein [Phormidium sp. CCY1219]MEB3830621.1 hypothetical protein [Phormidium sp. CCY1219]